MNRRFINFLQLLLGGLDIITLNLVVMLSSFIFRESIPEWVDAEYMKYWIMLNLGWMVVGWTGAIYSEKYITSFEGFSRRSMSAFLYWVGIIVIYLFFYRQFALSRLFIFVTIGSFGIMLLVNRFIYLVVYHYFRKQDYLVKKVLIVGYNDTSKKLVSYLETEGLNTQIVGYCEERTNVEELSVYPILSGIGEVMDTSAAFDVNEIYCTISPEDNREIYSLMHEADQQCIRFRLVPDMNHFVKGPIHIDYFRDIPVLSLRSEPLDEVSSRIKKRLFDIVVSSLVIIFLLSWLIPLIALIILIESRGPVFFVQLRSGKNNKPFYCIKFRSMKVNNDSDLKQATKNDSRLTRFGSFLRKSNLDEFPQFFNVLRGNMSLVGPRPHMLKHTADYSQLIGQYMVRQFLKPGITGWAQVNGLRGETRTVYQMQQRVEHDIWYMENWSMWLDMRIMFLTVYATIKGDENAF